jgi:hypothetical protein
VVKEREKEARLFCKKEAKNFYLFGVDSVIWRLALVGHPMGMP